MPFEPECQLLHCGPLRAGGSSSPVLLTTLPPQSKMANVTVFVDVANIAQYTQNQVTHCSTYTSNAESLS